MQGAYTLYIYIYIYCIYIVHIVVKPYISTHYIAHQTMGHIDILCYGGPFICFERTIVLFVELIRKNTVLFTKDMFH